MTVHPFCLSLANFAGVPRPGAPSQGLGVKLLRNGPALGPPPVVVHPGQRAVAVGLPGPPGHSAFL